MIVKRRLPVRQRFTYFYAAKYGANAFAWQKTVIFITKYLKSARNFSLFIYADHEYGYTARA